MQTTVDVDKLISQVNQIFEKPKKIKPDKIPKKRDTIPSSEPILSEKFNLLLRGRKKETKSVYQSEIAHFIRFTRNKKTPDEWDIRKFLNYLEDKNYSRSYQRNCWYALKKYFKANEFQWTLEINEYPKLERAKIKKITLSKEQVVKMIEAVKLDGSQIEKVFLALCSTYGIRKSEFCSLKEADIDRNSNILHIQTKKGGEERYHLIPKEIRDYIYPWNFDTNISDSKVYLIFNSILAKSKIRKIEGMGIHAIRRGLFTELASTDLPTLRISNFGRWKDRNIGMLAEYDNPDYKKVDKLIFSRHPFLELWK